VKRKIFISINLAERDKKRLVRATEKWQDLPVKWVKETNLHITLAFVGHVLDEDISVICEKVCEAVKDFEIVDLEFEKIELSPTAQNPKTIWLTGEASEELRLLQENIEKSLDIFISSKKTFSPHVTLGRIRQKKWQELEEAPTVEKNFPLTVTVESVDVMASKFEDDGQEYTVIQSCPLK
jgi:RNA 2',3'-cyclic 3'-phosphodiesterase